MLKLYENENISLKGLLLLQLMVRHDCFCSTSDVKPCETVIILPFHFKNGTNTYQNDIFCKGKF